MRKLAILCTLVSAAGLFSWGVADAQTVGGDRPPLPPGPLVAKAPAFVKIHISFSYLGEKADAAVTAAKNPSEQLGKLAPRQLSITRTESFWHSVLTDTAGRTAEAWSDGHNCFARLVSERTLSAAGEDITVQSPLLIGYDHVDFPDISWVSADTYTGVERMGDRFYIVFQQHGQDGATVLIDGSNHYPVQWKKGNEVRSFTFLNPPSEKLTLPPELSKLSKEFQRIGAVGRLQGQ